MIWPLLGLRKQSRPLPIQRLQITMAGTIALRRQEAELSFVKREQWTEQEVVGLPAGEHDYFDRKSGQLFDNQCDRNNLYDTLGKAASAFANSGGGHLILGVRDDGAIDGVPSIFSGSTTTREWLEQKLPDLLDYSLSDFRVHSVVPSQPTSIPANREIIVIDVGDSALAPHQSVRHNQYFYRSGGRSIPAPHFYLELLRQRLTNPTLDFELSSVDIDATWQHDGAIFLRLTTKVKIENTGRVAAYKWALVPRQHTGEQDRTDDYFFSGIPGSTGRMSSIRTDDTILPGCFLTETKIFGVRLRPETNDENGVRADLQALFKEMTIIFQLATETSPGKEKELHVGAALPVDKIIALLKEKAFIAA
jgi:Schlafen, AlbA_2